MNAAEERVDRLAEEEMQRKARRLTRLGVVYLVVAALLAPLYFGPAVGLAGSGILNLGTALLAKNKRKNGARVLVGLGAATLVTGIILTIMELVRFFQR